MKELSIEQKARAYDEALEKSKRLYEQGTITESLAYIFPELKESEDERIRKELLAVVNDLVLPDEQQSRFVSWLEKQGEQNLDWSEEDECYMGECISAIATKDSWSFEEKKKNKALAQIHQRKIHLETEW